MWYGVAGYSLSEHACSLISYMSKETVFYPSSTRPLNLNTSTGGRSSFLLSVAISAPGRVFHTFLILNVSNRKYT